MPKKSAGILLFKTEHKKIKIFLVHPGGPFWVNKDDGAWTIPKGEFEEETGIKISGDFIGLNPIKQKSGKIVFSWALEGDADPTKIKSNEFEIEWPPKSGKMKSFPEIDKASWFDLAEAKKKIIAAQSILIDELKNKCLHL